AGAVFRRPGLAVAPRFLWECLNSPAVNPSPTPASSNGAGGFPALRFPARFAPKLMGPILLAALSAAGESGIRTAGTRCGERIVPARTPVSVSLHILKILDGKCSNSHNPSYLYSLLFRAFIFLIEDQRTGRLPVLVLV